MSIFNWIKNIFIKKEQPVPISVKVEEEVKEVVAVANTVTVAEPPVLPVKQPETNTVVLITNDTVWPYVEADKPVQETHNVVSEQPPVKKPKKPRKSKR